MRLEPLQLWFRPAQGPLLSQLRPALLAAAMEQAGPGAQLLRWAITAAEPGRGLWIEAVVLVGDLVGQPAGLDLDFAQQALAPQANRLPQSGADGFQAPGAPVPGSGTNGLGAARAHSEPAGSPVRRS